MWSFVEGNTHKVVKKVNEGVTMLNGEFGHSVDAKGRVTMPSKFREELGELCYVTRGLDHCLLVYSTEEWEKFTSKLKSANLFNKTARKIQQYFIATSIDCTFDKQGRILINQQLRDYANIDKDVMIVGLIDRIEIWPKDKWNQHIDITPEEMDELAAEFEGFGI